MNSLDLAYMAGVFDGEGCIHITKVSEYNSRHLILNVTLTNEYIPNLFQYHFGGSVCYKDKSRGKHPEWRPQWSWVVASRLASVFLETILPYLRLKKAEAELGIAFQKGRRLRGTKLTLEEEAIGEAQYILMRNLKKGVIDEKADSI